MPCPTTRADTGSSCRPDTYLEANLAPAYKARPGALTTLLIGDFDGRLGSGRRRLGRDRFREIRHGVQELGLVGLDPGVRTRTGRPATTQETFSSIVCDRWIFRNLYMAGGDAGLFWDLTDKSGEGFTVVVEDCVGTGPRLRRRGLLSRSCARTSRASFAAATFWPWTGWATRRRCCWAAGRSRCPSSRTPCSRTARWSIPTTPWPCPTPAIAPARGSSTAA